VGVDVAGGKVGAACGVGLTSTGRAVGVAQGVGEGGGVGGVQAASTANKTIR